MKKLDLVSVSRRYLGLVLELGLEHRLVETSPPNRWHAGWEERLWVSSTVAQVLMATQFSLKFRKRILSLFAADERNQRLFQLHMEMAGTTNVITYAMFELAKAHDILDMVDQ
jgi:hypothetical protein